MLTLIAIALCLRVVGVVLRVTAHPLAWVPGWILCLLATWGMAGAAGIALPVWMILPIAFVGAWMELREGDAWWILQGDAVLLLLLATLAVPTPHWSTMAIVLVGIAPGWMIIEAAVRSSPPLLRHLALAAGIVGVAGLAMRTPFTPDPLASHLPVAHQLTVTPRCEGEPVTLPGGMVAWFHVPNGTGPHPGALLLHGAHPLGSRQPAQCSLVRSFLHIGHAVLSVDHPGYGESPAPGPRAAIEEWDPLPGYHAAYEWLASHDRVSAVEAVAGHSMGSVGAIRLLSERPEIPRTFLFGAALDDPPARDPYWHERFHTDRGLSFEVPFEQWQEIRDRYFSFAHAARAMPPDHGQVVFVEYGWEWDNLEEVRDRQYERIPGSKAHWRIERSTHYFTVGTWHGLLVADGGVLRALARGLRSHLDHPDPSG